MINKEELVYCIKVYSDEDSYAVQQMFFNIGIRWYIGDIVRPLMYSVNNGGCYIGGWTYRNGNANILYTYNEHDIKYLFSPQELAGKIFDIATLTEEQRVALYLGMDVFAEMKK